MTRPQARTALRRPGMAVVIAVLVLAMLNLMVALSIRPSADESLTSVQRAETVRAFYAGESGGAIVVRTLLDTGAAPGAGATRSLSGAVVEIVSVPDSGPGTIIVEGRAGSARRRIEFDVE